MLIFKKGRLSEVSLFSLKDNAVPPSGNCRGSFSAAQLQLAAVTSGQKNLAAQAFWRQTKVKFSNKGFCDGHIRTAHSVDRAGQCRLFQPQHYSWSGSRHLQGLPMHCMMLSSTPLSPMWQMSQEENCCQSESFSEHFTQTHNTSGKLVTSWWSMGRGTFLKYSLNS